MHQTSKRRATSDELHRITRATRVDVPSIGCIVLLGAIPGAGLVVLSMALARALFPRFAWIAVLIATAATAAAIAWVLASFLRDQRPRLDRAKADAAGGEVEEILGEPQRVVRLNPLKDDEPVLGIDFGDGWVLWLKGQWLWEAETYGAPSPSAEQRDAADGFVNGLPEPHAFPSSRFRITRFPQSGEVVNIAPMGSYLAPERVEIEMRLEWDFDKSAFVAGSVSDIEASLRSAASGLRVGYGPELRGGRTLTPS